MKELNEFVCGQLLPYYCERHFENVDILSTYRMNRDEFEFAVALYPTFKSNSIFYTPSLMVVCNRIEKIKHGVLALKTRLLNLTVNARQGKILARRFNVKDYEEWAGYSITNEFEANEMVVHHKKFMDNVGWKFFEQNSDIKGIDKFLTSPILGLKISQDISDQEKIQLVRNIGGLHVMVNGVIAAWLNKNPDFDRILIVLKKIMPTNVLSILDQLIAGLNSWNENDGKL